MHGSILNYMYNFAPRLRYTSNKIVGVVVGGLEWRTGMVADIHSNGHNF